MKNKMKSICRYLADHQFALFIIICITIAFIMTLISLELYRRSGAMNLDMSRPGYESVRTEVEQTSDDRPYSSSGSLTNEAITDFEERLNNYKDELNNLGTYDNSIVSDENLNLTPLTSSQETTENTN